MKVIFAQFAKGSRMTAEELDAFLRTQQHEEVAASWALPPRSPVCWEGFNARNSIDVAVAKDGSMGFMQVPPSDPHTVWLRRGRAVP